MTRQELKDAIHARGVEFKSGLTKAELQAIYNKLYVHSAPAKKINLPTAPPKPKSVPSPEPDTIPAGEPSRQRVGTQEAEPEPEPIPAGEPIPEPEPEPAPAGEPEPEPAPSGEFDELLGKIGSAQAPEPSVETERPLFEKTRRKKKKGESSPDSFRVEGYVLLLVTDTIFPFAFAFINNALDKRTKIKAEELQLADKDFAKLEPLADQAADYMSINLNPIAGFFLVASFMYGNNLIVARTSKEPK